MMKEEFHPNLSKEHADLKISVKTIQRFFRRYIPRQVKEKFKNSGRIDVYNNIITPFSFCCLIIDSLSSPLRNGEVIPVIEPQMLHRL
jgi:hypothetical protein